MSLDLLPEEGRKNGGREKEPTVMEKSKESPLIDKTSGHGTRSGPNSSAKKRWVRMLGPKKQKNQQEDEETSIGRRKGDG